MIHTIPDPAKFRAKILRNVQHAGSCWEWQGGRTTEGYGHVYIALKKRAMAHRVAYLAFVGDIPDGLVIDHLCRNRICVNPAHLEPVSQWTNIMRGESPGAQALRTGHCKRGHERTTANVRGTDCVICRRMRDRSDKQMRRRAQRLREKD